MQVAANQIVDLIHERASLSGCPEVLLLSNSIKNLVLSSSPSQVSTTHVSTPQQLAKNFITNASFRAKKMHTDIPKVQVDAAIAEDSGASAHSSTASAKPNLASMSSIVEEENRMMTTEAEDKVPNRPAETTSTTSKGAKVLDKLKLRKKATPSTSDAEQQPSTATASASLNVEQQPLLKPKLSFEKKDKKDYVKSDKKKRERNERGSETEMTPLMPPAASQPPVEINGDNTSSLAFGGSTKSANNGEFDSVEKVEELIQMKKLPAETITIHSPESGTTIF